MSRLLNGFIMDAKHSSNTVWEGICRSPFLLGAMVALALLEHLFPQRPWIVAFIVNCLFCLAMQAISCKIIRSYAGYLGLPDQSQKPIRLGSLFVLKFLDSIFDTITNRLWFLPLKIYWTVKTSTAMVLICQENQGLRQSLKSSFQLTQGRFWYTLRYLVLAYTLICIPYSLAFTCLHIAIARDHQLLTPLNSIELKLASLFAIAATLNIYPFLVRIYTELSAPPAGSGTESPTAYNEKLISSPIAQP